MLFDEGYFAACGLGDIHRKVLAKERLDREDGLRLFECPDLAAVGTLAAHVRFALHGANTTYVVNRQINYTNICVNDCLFCAFRRDAPHEPGAFALSHADILKKVDEACALHDGLDELHMVGGCHPELPLSWFEELLRLISAKYPRLPLKAFTPVEIAHFAKKAGITTRETLERLRAVGLKMMPGGGAEIFAPELRSRICPAKADGQEWLQINEEAHSLGIKTNCTMLFGHLETPEQRVDHLLALRSLQDRTGGFTCFIPLPFLKQNNKIHLPAAAIHTEVFDQLRTIAASRLLLDNIPHIKAYWIMLEPKIAQTALEYGANDLDGTIVEEKIGHMAGANSTQGLTLAGLEEMIRQSGFVPVRRNALFENAGGLA